MVAREIGRHSGPIYEDLYVFRPRSASSLPTRVAPKQAADPYGEHCCIRFFNADKLVYEEHVPMIAAGGARAVYTAYQESLKTWQNKATFSPHELERKGFSLKPDEWDRAEVNGKSFPRNTPTDDERPSPPSSSFKNFRPFR